MSRRWADIWLYAYEVLACLGIAFGVALVLTRHESSPWGGIGDGVMILVLVARVRRAESKLKESSK